MEKCAPPEFGAYSSRPTAAAAFVLHLTAERGREVVSFDSDLSFVGVLPFQRSSLDSKKERHISPSDFVLTRSKKAIPYDRSEPVDQASLERKVIFAKRD